VRGPVVVGVDGTAAARRAVRWAAEYAGRHGNELRLVHAVERPYGQDRVARVLRMAEGVARETVTGLAVTVATGEMSPAELLIRESGHASLVVLDGPGHGGYSGQLIGDTTRRLAAQGRCPMVSMTGEPGQGPVVVGTDGTRTSDAAVAFAVHEAAVRGTDLLAVLGCPQTAAGGEPPGDAVETVAGWLVPWRARYPEVKISQEVVLDTPGRALLGRAVGAQLVVVGSRRRVGYRGLVLRATSQLLLHHAPCPVAVVRWDHIT
jgi:nucleotide-binding universal stress UspA family protein